VLGDLGDVVERTEGDVPVAQCRCRADVGCTVSAETEHAAWQHQRLFTGQAGHVAGVDGGVGDAEVGGRHTADSGVAQVRHLHRGGCHRKHEDARIFGVAGQVHNDVHAVGTDLPVQCVVGQAVAFKPVVAQGLEALGHGVAIAAVVVQKNLETVAVVSLQQAGDERRDRVADEVARHITHLQPLPRLQGVPGPAWLRRWWQLASEFGVQVEDFLRVFGQVVGTQQQHRVEVEVLV